MISCPQISSVFFTDCKTDTPKMYYVIHQCLSVRQSVTEMKSNEIVNIYRVMMLTWWCAPAERNSLHLLKWKTSSCMRVRLTDHTFRSQWLVFFEQTRKFPLRSLESWLQFPLEIKYKHVGFRPSPLYTGLRDRCPCSNCMVLICNVDRCSVTSFYFSTHVFFDLLW